MVKFDYNKSIRKIIIKIYGKFWILNRKNGAFKPMVLVQPVTISYKKNVHYDFTWGKKTPIYVIIFLTLTQFVNYVEIKYLPSVNPNINDNIQSFSDKVRNNIAQSLNISLNARSYHELIDSII
jgi:hypothetical protein